jgi:uncharacterized RDD family membrane protein YckC
VSGGSSVGDTGPIPHGSGVVNRSGIVTPDAVGLDLQIATLGSRGAAYVLDLSIFLVVGTLLGIGQALLGGAGFVPGWLGIALLLLLAFLWQFGYPIGFEVLARGRTPGKAALGLRVVTVEGAPVRLRHATIRAVVGLLELIGTTGAIAVVSSFASPRSQRLGDMAAGTLVVRERRGGGTPAVETFVAPAGLETYTARLDVSGLQASDYATIRETLRRARELAPAVRVQLSTELAQRFTELVRPAPPPEATAEQFLTCIAAAVQARRAGAAVPEPRTPRAGAVGGRSTDPGDGTSAPPPRHEPGPAATEPGRWTPTEPDPPGPAEPAPPARPGTGFAPPA